MKKPTQRLQRVELSKQERIELASRASYEGSCEHKDRRWWGGLPCARQLPGGRIGRRGKQQSTICPFVEDEDREKATSWVRQAIRNGNYEFIETDHHFPKKIWYRDHLGRTWGGMCINTDLGTYKGWPVDD